MVKMRIRNNGFRMSFDNADALAACFYVFFFLPSTEQYIHLSHRNVFDIFQCAVLKDYAEREKKNYL